MTSRLQDGDRFASSRRAKAGVTVLLMCLLSGASRVFAAEPTSGILMAAVVREAARVARIEASAAQASGTPAEQHTGHPVLIGAAIGAGRIAGINGLFLVFSSAINGRPVIGSRARLLRQSVKVAGPHRILRIRVDPRKADCELMASIGHELQHAVEVLIHPAITTNQAIFFFFHRLGSTEKGRFETTAAVQAGLKVGVEMQERGQCR
jgi:hypothetical protein